MTNLRAPGTVKHFSLCDAAFDIPPLRAKLLRDSAGAYASFEGWVRDHNDGRAVSGMRYEAYDALALAEGNRVLQEACDRFSISHASCVHRTGTLVVGDLAVWVGVSAPHRDAAFEACRYVIDQVKSRVPIWKQEDYVHGDTAWLHPRSVSKSE